jgi:hypothetical protein
MKIQNDVAQSRVMEPACMRVLAPRTIDFVIGSFWCAVNWYLCTTHVFFSSSSSRIVAAVAVDY